MAEIWLEDPLTVEILSAVNPHRMWEMVKYFSTLHRDSGTPDEHKACQYVVDQLREQNIPVEVYEFNAFLSHPVFAELEAYSPVSRNFEVLTHSFSANTPLQGVHGEVAFIGAPHFEPGMEMDESAFGSVDLRGKIALSEGLVRPWKARVAQEKGAVALINVNSTDQLHNLIVTTVWGTPGIDEMGKIPSIPVVSMRQKEGQTLIRMCRQGKVSAVVRTRTDTGWLPVILPIARVEGRDPQKFILVHGHIDSWHAGVTDNATGNATKLELARVFHSKRERLRNSILFAWWPCHSTGRYAGSAWYCDQFWQTIYENAIVDINVDSTGVRNATHIAPKQTYELNPFIKDLVMQFIQRGMTAQGAKMEPLGRQGRHADQSFWANCGSNIRIDFNIHPDHPDWAKMGGSGGGFWWHTEHDTLDKADRELLGRDTRLIALLLVSLANSAVFPFEHREVTIAIEKRLENLQASCQGAFDFSRSLQEAKRCGEACAALFQKARTARESGDGPLQQSVNRKMLTLNRILNPALFTDCSAFRHQPAQPVQDLPGLSLALDLPEVDPESAIAQFTKTQLRREENRLIWALRQAQEVISIKD